MKILVIGDPHGNLKNIKKISMKDIDLILITGDLGKADLARKRYFENIERRKRGLDELEETIKDIKKIHLEVYNSTINLLKYLTKFAPVYSILGNVGTSTDVETKKENEKLGIRLPYFRKNMKRIKDFNLVRNNIRNINGVRIGFLEYFIDVNWVKDFKPSEFKIELKNAKKETDKAKRILKNFNELDILVCHQPPYGVLDKVKNKFAPKNWYGKKAGSKLILDYIKSKKLRYVFCGHIHEAKGKIKLGETIVINVGCCGDFFILDID
jgi:Icc-related predicted phosphoesterase